jgi:2',3'-cyclic-nucleotide 2'-phosphodiesterase (5'-nucleotidase family)
MLNKYSSLVNAAKNKIVTTIQIPMRRDRENNSPLANFACDMLRNITNTDFCILNQGMFRAIWYPGPISYYKYYEMFSLNSEIVTVRVSGKQLRRIMEILNSGIKAFYATSGMTSYVTADPKKLVNLTRSDGSELIDDKEYTFVSNEFFIEGGDDFSKVLKEFPVEIEREYGEFKDLTVEYIKRFPMITKQMVMHPEQPSLVFVKSSK